MSDTFIKKIFPLVAISLLIPWPVAYAHSYQSDMTGESAVQIEVAPASDAPRWSAFGGAIGGVTNPGDLFYINAINCPADILINLRLTNTNELIHCYRYMTLKVGTYVQTDASDWTKAAFGGGKTVPDTYITLRNGQVNFTLPGCARYRVTIDNGCFYCITTNSDGGSVSPRFYLSAG